MADDRDIGKIWGELREFRAETEGRFREIMQILVGHDGTNGLSGRVAVTEEKIDSHDHQIAAGIDWGKRIIEVERHKPGWCKGVNALDEYKAATAREIEARERETVELKKSRHAMIAGLGAAVLTAAASVIVAVLR